jgi:hypothetical protein
MRLGIFRPFKPQINVALLLLWVAIGAGVIFLGSRSGGQRNHPGGLLLLGVGLAGPGLLALMALLSPALREQIVDPEYEPERSRVHLAGLTVLGLAGLYLVWSGLGRLL